ncbi:hypothetical protein SCUCBS95973_003720 [Sporothrix curviconia]|uniref:SMP-LTD domain-containing protein n=1 Tax=Sporothrix curviconia TaxID=1260050 RepID=A0ABP0BHQ2_9PEZI
MASLTTFLLVYLFGGLTFLPLLLAVAVYAWTRPVSADAQTCFDDNTLVDATKTKDNYQYDGLVLPGDDVKTLATVRREHAQERNGGSTGGSTGSGGAKKHKHRQDPIDDFATAGYFAVHRKYVAMGGNLRPIERGSSVGSAEVAPPSPSVYQTFFRSMLNKKPGPDKVEVSNAASPRPKNAHNMFYVVLRHGHLILFDDDQQVDVRHVIKLADHDVRIYSGADVVPEGELFIKRNAIQLMPKNHERAKAHNAPAPRPWFFYCENCSEKEDFYFSLIRSQENAPKPHEIDVRHLTALMERLHASEEAAEMRWFNALLGRLFLGVYKTSNVLKFIESKIITKLSRTPRPNFIASIVVQRVDVGETTPQITSPRLKSLTAEGECIVEADVRYTGRFEIDLAATLRVSTPIGQQEVKTSLAVVLTQLEGHMLFKVKGPPSNRIWFTFRHMPKIEMETRPIIMARQLTWPVFIQLIEGKIKEAISESIVLPFWDDTPFFPTEKKAYRGGLWEDETDREHEGTAIRTEATGGVHVETGAGAESNDKAATSTGVSVNPPGNEENVSPAVLRLRRLSKTHSAPVSGAASPAALTAAATAAASEAVNSAAGKPINRKQRAGDGNGTSVVGASPPKRFSRTTSALASPSEPTVGTDRSHAEASIQSSSPPKNGKPANSAMSWLSSGTLRSRKSSVSSLESATPGQGGSRAASGKRGGSKEEDAEADDSFFPVDDSGLPVGRSKTARPGTATTGDGSDTGSIEGRSTTLRSGRASSSSLSGMAGSRPSTTRTPPLNRKPSIEPSFTTTISSDSATPPAKRSAVLAAAMTGAAQSAKRWGINALQRRAAAAADRKAKANFEQRTTSSGELLDLSKPMGGGMPLPPPGEPLPMPSELALAKDGGTPSPTPALPPARITPIKRRPTTESMFYGPNGQSPLHSQVPHEQLIRRKEVHPQAHPKQPARTEDAIPHPRQGQSTTFDDILGHHQNIANSNGNEADGSPFAFDGQDDMMVVEAPIDSESDVSDEEVAAGNGKGSSSSLHESAEELHDIDTEGTARAQPPSSLGDEPNFSTESMSTNNAPSDIVHETPLVTAADNARETASISAGSGQDSPAAEDEDDVDPDDAQDDAQWGSLAESVISAFLEGENGQVSEEHGEAEAKVTGTAFEPQSADDDSGTKETETPPKHSPASSPGERPASISV